MAGFTESYQDLQQFTVNQLKEDKAFMLTQTENIPGNVQKEFQKFYDEAIKAVSNMRGQTVAQTGAEYTKTIMDVLKPIAQKLETVKGQGSLAAMHVKNTMEFVNNLEKSLLSRPPHPASMTMYAGKIEKPEKYGIQEPSAKHVEKYGLRGNNNENDNPGKNNKNKPK